MTPAPHEKRRELRKPAEGSARVMVVNTEPLEILGRLIDVSTGGFRMAHDCQLLGAGQVVEFTHDHGAGKARVVWTRIVAGYVESGFLVTGAGM